VKSKRKHSPEFARRWRSDGELAVKGQSARASALEKKKNDGNMEEDVEAR
jgi:hypothetical protein